MENIEKKIVKTERIIHKFYCDICNEYLGESEELNDGYYRNIGSFEAECRLPDKYGWYIVEKCLCENCRKQYLNSLVNKLYELGFK